MHMCAIEEVNNGLVLTNYQNVGLTHEVLMIFSWEDIIISLEASLTFSAHNIFAVESLFGSTPLGTDYAPAKIWAGFYVAMD